MMNPYMFVFVSLLFPFPSPLESAKWRAVIKVNERDLPTEAAIWENCHGLARYAAIAQENGLVPIVEPEVTLGPGDYSIERTAFISERVNTMVMHWLNRYK